MTETVLSNARLVLRDSVVAGHVHLRDGLIGSVDSGAVAGAAVDMQGDYLLPGLVELHTDNLERHVTPRPNAVWPMLPAVIAHDAQIAAAGITTVFDAIALGDVLPISFRTENLTAMVDGVDDAMQARLLRIEHYLHLRCEVCFPALPDLLDPLLGRAIVRLASIMDHTPGQRQFVSMQKYADYYQAKYGMTDAEFADFVAARRGEQTQYAEKHRRHVVDICHAHAIPMASHDDATAAHVAAAVRDGLTIAEFPTTAAAALACNAHGMAVMMGAPNLLRGGSHSGNVSARDLAADGLVDILSSDYVPSSLIPAAFRLADLVDGVDLPAAVRCISANPAASVGLNDRGEIAPGLLADLVQVRETEAGPAVVAVWKRGERVL